MDLQLAIELSSTFAMILTLGLFVASVVIFPFVALFQEIGADHLADSIMFGWMGGFFVGTFFFLPLTIILHFFN